MDLETIFLIQMTINSVVVFLFLVVTAGMWAVFRKADQPGWAAIIPVYNVYILVHAVARLDILWFIMCLIPGVGIFAWGVVCGEVARRFGRGVGTGIGLSVLPYYYWPMLGFNDDHYIRKLKPNAANKFRELEDEYDDEDDDDEPPPRRRRR